MTVKVCSIPGPASMPLMNKSNTFVGAIEELDHEGIFDPSELQNGNIQTKSHIDYHPNCLQGARPGAGILAAEVCGPRK